MIEFRLERKTKDSFLGILILLPSLLLISFIMIYPLIEGFLTSFKRYDLITPDERGFIGFQNYLRLFKDPIFYEVLKNTFIIIISIIIGSFIIGLFFALLLNQKIKLKNIFRGLILVSWIMPGVVTSLLFLYMFNSEVGIVNHILKSLGIITKNISWFGNTNAALFAVIATSIWTQFPFFMLMFLAALQTIPEDIIEASQIDGVNIIQRFLHITLPYLKNIMLITSTLMVIWNFNSFDIIWTLSKGGPNYATSTLSIYTYIVAFAHYDIGYATSIGVVWLLILLAFSYFFIRVMGTKRD